MNTSFIDTRLSKKIKTEDLKLIVMVRLNSQMPQKAKPVTVKALLDSGGSISLVCQKYVDKLWVKKLPSNQVWTKPGEQLTTTAKVRGQFTIPKLFDNQMIEWDLYVVPDMGVYDMIIGQDLLVDLGIDIRFSTNTVIWDTVEIPMKSRGTTIQSFHLSDPKVIQEATARVQGILKAKYTAAKLRDIFNKSMHLIVCLQEQLFAALTKYVVLFDGSLGT
jgi:Retroviral aspartyl protease